MKISLIQPSRNNLKYLEWSYYSIRKNQGNHEVEICVADDASTDGTTRLGHTILYDRLVNEVATNDICMIYHADMYLCPGAIDSIEEHLVEKTIVSLTRIEPPLHPPGPEKIIKDFGIEPEEFDGEELLEWFTCEYEYENIVKTTEGIFAPWAFYKKDFQEIGGHDPLFAPQSKEDSDIFNRFQLNGVKFVQTWKGCVYHMTCRGSRFADGAKRNPDGQVFMKNRETDEWLAQNQRATRNFIRKWGHFVKHDVYLKPIIPPKYDIGFIFKGGDSNFGNDLKLLALLEPWSSTIYVDTGLLQDYIQTEQANTIMNLHDRVKPLDNEKNNEILVAIDETKFTQQDFQIIQQLPDIIKDSGVYGEFELGNLDITINGLETFEHNLIINKK